MPKAAFKFAAWMEINERDKNGNLIKRWSEFDANLILENSFTYSVTIEKSLTSNADTATISITNHPVLEELYKQKKAYFNKFNEKHLELSILMYYEYPHVILFPEKTNCIFTGDVSDIYVDESENTNDQGFTLKATCGNQANLRAEVNKSYNAGMSYRQVVEDLFKQFNKYGHELYVLDDPKNKLNKPLKRARSFHGKVSEALNDIAKDLDMIWGFDGTPWTYKERGPIGIYPGIPSNPAAINRPKRAWFVDKISVFDITGMHSDTGKERPIRGVNGLEINGSTGKLGLIGYTKSQFSFSKLFDPSINIGMPVFASDVGARDQYVEFIGRINRVSINNEIMKCECSYVDEKTGLAILEKDAKNVGALIL